VTTTALIREIFKKIQRFKIIILLSALLFAGLSFFILGNKRTTYTAKTTLFPLTSSSDNAISGNMLSGILGLSDAPKSFSNEATINIIELALSRSIRESVALTRLSKFQNKSIAELLLLDKKDHVDFFDKPIAVSTDSTTLSIEAGEILKPSINAKMSKNGVLELYYTGTQKELVSPISNVIIDKLSAFYIELKRRKALDDYNFTLDKIDSLQRMINKVDRAAISMQQTTMFTPNDLLEYNIPKSNISAEKTRILRQRDMYINNRDEAVWRLQKVTPIISVLDKPTEPFDVVKPSIILYMLIGFILGSIVSITIIISGLLYRFVKSELYKNIFGEKTG
jgi:uncharacterized protein involved in exopolysaccharide biosynthesis